MAHPFIPAANTAVVEMVYTYAGVIVENVYHVQGSTPFTALTLSGLANTFDAWDNAVTGYKAVRNSSSSLILIRTRALDTASSPVFTFTLPVARAGAGGASPLPGNVTFAIKLETGLAGRSFRGRVFIVAPSGTNLQAAPNQNLVTAVYANACVTALNLLVSSITAAVATNKLVVASYRTLGAYRAAAVLTPIINASYANLRIDTQRRRLV